MSVVAVFFVGYSDGSAQFHNRMGQVLLVFSRRLTRLLIFDLSAEVVGIDSVVIVAVVQWSSGRAVSVFWMAKKVRVRFSHCSLLIQSVLALGLDQDSMLAFLLAVEGTKRQEKVDLQGEVDQVACYKRTDCHQAEVVDAVIDCLKLQSLVSRWVDFELLTQLTQHVVHAQVDYTECNQLHQVEDEDSGIRLVKHFSHFL